MAVEGSSGLLLGFDYGERRIGVAVGASRSGSARPLTTVNNRASGPDWEKIDALVREWRPVAAVVGEPMPEDGSPHALDGRLTAFCRELAGRYGLTVHRVNEAYSSREARSRLKDARIEGRGKRITRAAVDPLAAALILQGYLEVNGSVRTHVS
jgi:putative Holliday junction resolvase